MERKIEFLGGTTRENSFEYEERKKYLEYFRSKGFNLLDTLYERRLYGFLNKKGHVVMPINNVTRFGVDSGTTTGLNYVVDCFNYIRKIYRENDRILVPEPIIDLVPKRSFEDFDSSYEVYEQIFLERVMPILEERLSGERVTLLEFIEELEKVIFRSEVSDTPMTKSGFALSTYSTAYHTGLYVDVVAEQDGTIDLTKPDFFEDENFECYVKLAEENGFFVDANCPWRLVLDLESPITQRKILNGRPQEEFDKFYYDVYTINVGYDDFWALRSFCQKLFIEYHRRFDYSLASMPRLSDQDRWLEFLIVNRFKELSLMLTPEQKTEKEFSDTLKKAKEINKAYGLTSNLGALGFLNDFFGTKILESLRKDENYTNLRHQEQLQRNLSNRIESI